MKQDYIGTYVNDGCVINMIIKAEYQEDASDGFRKYIEDDRGINDFAEIRVRPLNLIQIIEV